jgi:hypothetical protein
MHLHGGPETQSTKPIKAESTSDNTTVTGLCPDNKRNLGGFCTLCDNLE